MTFLNASECCNTKGCNTKSCNTKTVCVIIVLKGVILKSCNAKGCDAKGRNIKGVILNLRNIFCSAETSLRHYSLTDSVTDSTI